MRKGFKQCLALCLTGCMAFGQPLMSGGALPANAETVESLTGAGDTMQSVVYSTTYKDPVYKSPKEEQPWREGLVTGNGEIGLLESENPLEDVLIYQHIKFGYPSNDYHQTPELSGSMETARKLLVENKRNTARDTLINAATSWQKSHFPGAGNWALQNTYDFHPGHQLRMKITNMKQANDYRRFTNYETAEIGAEWTDENGTKWIRTSFSSRADRVTYTYVRPAEGQGSLNMDLSIDDISDMANEGGGDGKVADLRYRKIAGENGEFLAQVAHYPNYEHSDLKEGGYAGVTRIYAAGENAGQEYVEGPAEAVDNHVDDRRTNGKVPDETKINVGSDKNPVIRVSNAEGLVLVTKSARTYDMGTLEAFLSKSDDETLEYELVRGLLQDTENAYHKNCVNQAFSYENALQPHAKLHGEIFDRTRLDLHASEEDRALTNEELLAKQKADNKTMNLALAERAYNNGRYANICCSGYQVPRLGGMWTGAWHVEWSGDYTTDANINLQVAGSNIGNMRESIEGLLDMELRISSDMVENAYNIYGIRDAMLAPTRTDGDSAPIIHFGTGFPGHIWNAGVSWLLLPVYEYWMCFGDQKIPLVDDIRAKLQQCQANRKSGAYVPSTEEQYQPVQDLQDILDLTDERVQEILDEGYFDLESDLLRPLLTKQANLWTGLMSPHYYLKKNGLPAYDPDKTELEDGESYLILPSYSPENQPGDGQSDVAINAAMDVSAARDGMNMAIAMEKQVKGAEADQGKISEWQNAIDHLPDYMYEATGEVKEWMVKNYPERHGHRHISHLYGAWPAHETEYDNELLEGAKMAIQMRENAAADGVAGHSWMHKGLVQARLKNSAGVSKILNGTLSSRVFYSSMMTSHNLNSGGTGANAQGLQAYCTDTAITLPAIMLESLVYSSNGVIELVPALPEEWKQGGTVTGVVARTRATVDSMTWDEEGVTASITSNEEQSIRLKAGKTWSEALVDGKPQTVQVDDTGDAYILLDMKKGESKTIRFTYSDRPTGYYAMAKDGYAVGVKDNGKEEGAAVVMSPMQDIPASAQFVTGESDQALYDGYVYIKQASTNWYFNVDGSQRKNENGKMVYYNGAVNGSSADKGQFFRLEDAGDGYVRIAPYLYVDGEFKSYNHVLGIDTSAADRSADGTKITHSARADAGSTEEAYQLWSVLDFGSFVAFQNKATGKYINAAASSYTDLTQSSGGTPTATGCQIWQFVSVDGSVGTYKIINTTTGRMLCADGGRLTVKRSGSLWIVTEDGTVMTEDGTKALRADGEELSLTDPENGTVFSILAQPETEIIYAADALTIDGDGVVNDRISLYEGDKVTLTASTEPARAMRNGVKWYVTDQSGKETDRVTVSAGVVSLGYESGGARYKVYAKVNGSDVTSNVITITSKRSNKTRIDVGKNNYIANYAPNGDVNKKFGGEGRLGIQKNGTSDIKDAYLSFDLSGIDQGRNVEKVSLVLTFAENNGNSEFTLYAADASDVVYAADHSKPWDEDMRWSDIGYLGDNAYTEECAFATTQVTAGSAGDTFSMDVTDQAIRMKEQGKPLEMRLFQLVDSRIYVGSSRASNKDYVPYLMVQYADDTFAGDVNEDGTVTAVDALMALNIATGGDGYTEEQKHAADFDGNGTTDTKDVQAILKKASR